MDAVNIDLKGFTEEFYHRICGAQLAKVLETIEYVATQTDTWVELTTLVIPGHNDSEAELDAMTRWVVEHCGPDVPMHFSAFHPDWKMRDVPATPPATLTRARAIALANGVRYAYTGNVHDPAGDTTSCPGCHRPVIERDWYEIRGYHLDARGAVHRLRDGRSPGCSTGRRGRGAAGGCPCGSPRSWGRADGRAGRCSSSDRRCRWPVPPGGWPAARAGEACTVKLWGQSSGRPGGIREPAVAGRFYPGRASASGRETWTGTSPRPARSWRRGLRGRRRPDAAAAQGPGRLGRRGPLVAVVVPHAGHVYSGPTAAFAYASHRSGAGGAGGPARPGALRARSTGSARAPRPPGAPRWATSSSTPTWPRTSSSQIDTVVPADSAHAPEHSLEVQLPFLQRVLAEGWRLVPLIVGADLPGDVAAVIT